MKSVSGFYYVETASGVLTCKARGLFRKQGITPVVGDYVVLQEGDEPGTGLITEILPRKNVLSRPPLANIDKLFVVASTTEPGPNFLVLDRLIALCVDSGITPIIVITKADLHTAAALKEHYGKTPMLCIEGQAGAQGEGALTQILDEISGNICAFAGNSGVGKTTLLNRLAPGLGLATAQISQKLGRGKHTTRHVEMYHLNGGLLADTPGFSAIEISRSLVILKDDLQYAFAEFEPYIEKCKFTGCAHGKEKGCAVRAAVDDGEISNGRYQNYLALHEEAAQIKEWEL